MRGQSRATRDRLAPRGREHGYITVMVLTFAGLMAALVAATMHVARPSLGQAVVNIDELQADGLIDAGLAAAGYALYAAKAQVGAVDGLTVPLETGTVKVNVVPEGGRVDLNGADKRVLEGLYTAVGTGAIAAPAFAARILDWRDRNNKAERMGAESDEYRQMGLDYGPRNRAFLSVNELMRIPGITEEDFVRLAPYLTVFNPEGRIDPGGAELAVLRAVPQMTDAAAVEIKQAFADPDIARKELNRLIQPYRRFLAPRGNNVFRVRVEARLPGGYAKAVEAVIMSGGRASPYYVLHWKTFNPAQTAA